MVLSVLQPGNLNFARGESRHAAEQDMPHGAQHHDEQRVEQVAGEGDQGIGQQFAQIVEVIQGGLDHEQARRENEQLVDGLEGVGHHKHHREQHQQRQQKQEQQQRRAARHGTVAPAAR